MQFPSSTFWRPSLARHPVLWPAFLLAVWLLCTAAWRPLAMPDEGRYASISLEMAISGNWAVPLLNGLPFFHKPPLFYWINAAALKLFGPDPWVARMASLLGAWLMGMGLYLFLRRHATLRLAGWALAVLATQPFFFGGAQYANLDMLVASLISSTILAAAHAVLQARQGKPWRHSVWLAYLLAALGLLAKGLIGIVLPGAVLVAWLVWQRHWIGLWRLLSLPGALILLAVGMPWFILMDQRYPGFLHYFFVYQHFQRFAETGFNNQHGIWFYPVVLIGLTLPWSLWLFASLRGAWQQRQAAAGWRSLLAPARPLGSPASLQRLAWVWLLVITVFFSLPSSKLAGYILPVLPAWAMLLTGWALAWMEMRPHARKRLPAVLLAAALLCVAGIGAAARYQSESSRSAVPLLRQQMHASDEIIMLDEYEYDLPFYLDTDRPMWVVSAWDDPELLRHDNWRKELLEAGAFDIRSQATQFIRPPELAARLCQVLPQHRVWVWGDTESDTFQHYPFLRGLTPAWEHPLHQGNDALWLLQGQDAMKRLECGDASGRTHAK